MWVHTQAHITYQLGAIGSAVALTCLRPVAWPVASVSFGDLTPGCSLFVVVTVLAPLTVAPGGLGSLSAYERDSVRFKVPPGGGQSRCPEPKSQRFQGLPLSHL